VQGGFHKIGSAKLVCFFGVIRIDPFGERVCVCKNSHPEEIVTWADALYVWRIRSNLGDGSRE